ncbi:MAG TPA: peptidylprolyl isomerase [Candidatus Peregrinibacteria bacterium]|nr:peptidylprolyl isomerase [Candidatus Peregrinibacteria bacterium]
MIIDLTNKIAIVETNFGTIKFDFYEEEAPELSKNFALLAQDGFYDGLVFHRIIEGFMIQGGDPLGTGTGGHSYKGPGTKIGDEEGALKLRHDRGAVSWAKSSLPNSIGSQFFIVHQNSNFLDGGYSVFGNVIEGIEVVDKIADVETAPGDRPLEDVIMEKVYLEEK